MEKEIQNGKAGEALWTPTWKWILWGHGCWRRVGGKGLFFVIESLLSCIFVLVLGVSKVLCACGWAEVITLKNTFLCLPSTNNSVGFCVFALLEVRFHYVS